MCGIAGVFGQAVGPSPLEVMVGCQRHRGPDAFGMWTSPSGLAALGHRRLSILDLSDAGRQPMASDDSRYQITFNGEIYNYIELRNALGGMELFRTRTDTEVLLAAFARWNSACLDRLIGMFAFAVWDEWNQTLFAARDRFGVKPLYYYEPPRGGLWIASEIKALHAAGVPLEPDEGTWATYLASGLYDHDDWTFWKGVRRLPPGGCLSWSPNGGLAVRTWYDPADAVLARTGGPSSEFRAGDELLGLLEESVRLRFRSDVPVGLCLSGGLDSSLLLGLVRQVLGPGAHVETFTFDCGDAAYDETPWVQTMLRDARCPGHFAGSQPATFPDWRHGCRRFKTSRSAACPHSEWP
ncbi:asparagine synthase (glutamine-hydrolyzing) [Singulisphaera sp. Ch08]|uniref:asparagine synthase (glutamine-hydrolyzing) n=1 Tax=Singulisphaera sp. Ch08 TaxID=3120278 RepID=A0AAU7CQR2_9BACT